MRSPSPSRTTSIWPTSAITSPSPRPTSFAPRPAASAIGVNTGIVQNTQGGIGGAGVRRRRWWRRSALRLARAASCSPPSAGCRRFLPSIPTSPSRDTSTTPSFRKSTSSSRHSDPQNQHHPGSGQLQPVVPPRHQHLTRNISASASPTTSPTPASILSCIPNFGIQIPQPLLAGFGTSSNERYIRIAKRNAADHRPRL